MEDLGGYEPTPGDIDKLRTMLEEGEPYYAKRRARQSERVQLALAKRGGRKRARGSTRCISPKANYKRRKR